jgi:hypothetical protein
MEKFSLKKLAGRTALKRAFPQVRTISDADRSINVRVIEEDYTSGTGRKAAQPMVPEDCALAHACTRQLKADGVVITLGFSYVVRGTHATRYMTTEPVKREITSFDRHGDFRPGIYTLGHVPPSASLATMEERKEDRHTGTGTVPRSVTPKVLKGRTVGIRPTA